MNRIVKNVLQMRNSFKLWQKFEYYVGKKNLSLAIETVATHMNFFCTTYALHDS